MMSKNCSFQFLLMFFLSVELSFHLVMPLKQGTKSVPNNSAAASVSAALVGEAFLSYHTPVFPFQFYHFDTLGDCQIGHWRGRRSIRSSLFLTERS